MYDKGKNTSIIRSNGKIQFFSLNHFLNDIAEGNCCFICGAKPDSKDFNDEHVIPDWILKRFDLYSKTISLPNNTKYKYGSYKIKCCKDCNTELGEVYEKPISELLSKSYAEIITELKKDYTIIHTLFKWLCLIYIKTHLKDKYLNFDLDKRKDTGFLGDMYYWEELHHIHCIARSHYTGAIIDKNVYGSIFIFRALEINEKDEFDYLDSVLGKSIMIRIGEFYIIAVLNDGNAGYSLHSDQFKKINGSISPLQIREIISHLNHVNINLKDRPVFQSNIRVNGEYKITVKLPKLLYLIDEEDQVVNYKEFMKNYITHMIQGVENKKDLIKKIDLGNYSFLFNEKDEFIDNEKLFKELK